MIEFIVDINDWLDYVIRTSINILHSREMKFNYIFYRHLITSIIAVSVLSPHSLTSSSTAIVSVMDALCCHTTDANRCHHHQSTKLHHHFHFQLLLRSFCL